MKEIPISAARKIAEDYGYDQVVIIARRVGEEPDPCGEHVTTYGVDKDNCNVAARIGNFLKYQIMGWEPVPDRSRDRAVQAFGSICLDVEEIAGRNGEQVNWHAFRRRVRSLLETHKRAHADAVKMEEKDD